MRASSPTLIALAAALVLAGCAGKRTVPEDNAPTLKTLSGREADVPEDKGVRAEVGDAIAAYRKFLDTSPKAAQRSEAMRRLGDLSMDEADNRLASGSANAADYKAAITRYQDYLKAYPNDPGNDRVLYQLARAHEQGGELEVALKTLDRLVAEYPKTHYFDEAQFRRGELLFTTRDYAKAEKAFALVMQGDSANPYRERSLYMHGWSLFK